MVEFDKIPIDCNHIAVVHCYMRNLSNYVLKKKHTWLKLFFY